MMLTLLKHSIQKINLNKFISIDGKLTKEVFVEFEDRAVAFIDILGFKSLVQHAVTDEEQFKQLSGLIELLAGAVPILNSGVNSSVAAQLIPEHIYISDCIILSAPLTHVEHSNYDGLSVVVMRAIQLSHYFLQAGYLIRGGISVGKVWHTNSNIVGPAYQEAYLLESNGDEPIILLSESAVEQWRKGSLMNSRMCLQYEDKVFVNGLLDFYIPNNNTYGEIERIYSKYETIVDQNIENLQLSSPQKKWNWFKQFLQSEVSEKNKWMPPR